MSLAQALAFTLKEEGGYVDDPDDHGGATNHGVTQGVYDSYRRGLGVAPGDIREMSAQETADIYRTVYWAPAHCEELEPRLGVCHFDWAVNHGVTGALQTLQLALALPADGVFGPATRAAVDFANAEAAIARYLAARRTWYLDRVKDEADQARFLDGWLGRVGRLQAYLETLA